MYCHTHAHAHTHTYTHVASAQLAGFSVFFHTYHRLGQVPEHLAITILEILPSWCQINSFRAYTHRKRNGWKYIPYIQSIHTQEEEWVKVHSIHSEHTHTQEEVKVHSIRVMLQSFCGWMPYLSPTNAEQSHWTLSFNHHKTSEGRDITFV